jgi:hypothetical protein
MFGCFSKLFIIITHRVKPFTQLFIVIIRRADLSYSTLCSRWRPGHNGHLVNNTTDTDLVNSIFLNKIIILK